MLTKTKALSCACATLCAALVMIIALPQRAAADGDDPPGRVARLSFLRGAVSFQPAGESDWVPAAINRPMTTGDKLWADMDSRAELHIGSAAIRLDGNTGFSFLNLDDRTVQIQLSAGTLNLRVRRLERDEIFEVDTPNQAFSILRPGEYRLEASEDGTGTIVKVIDGKGEATGAGRSYTIESHERASLTGSDTLDANIDKLERRDRDDFDDWCEERDHRDERSRSAQYVSPQMVGYEDLDDNGEWRHDPEYGEVWVPTAVAVGWAPYHYGHWAWIAPWGWTWVDDAPWGYAPFHYGRWAYGRGAWFWVPGPVGERAVYAPALVAFVGGPNFAVGIAVGGGAAVGWFPLGPREVFVPAYRVSPAYVNQVNVSNTNVSRTTVTNVYNTTVVNNNTTVVNNVNNVTYVNRTAPGAVTAVPSNTFTSSQPVASAAVKLNPNQIANAPVVTRAAVAPTQNSVLGPSEHAPRRAVPPERADRPVVAKATPPPPPVSFEKQQSALAAHPGQPLARNEVENIRPANAERPLVRQAAPSQPGTPNRGGGQVAGTPGAPNRQPGNPANGPANGAPNRPAGNPSVTAPPRNDRPGSVQPDNRPALGEAPNARPSNAQPTRPGQPADVEPSNNRPANVQPSYRPPSPENRANPAPPSNERPSINNGQPNRPATEPSNNRPANEQPSYRPSSPENRPNPAPPSNERPSINNAQPNRPATEPSNNRPANVQPSYRPSSPDNRPNPAPPSNERPSINNAQPNRPASEPSNNRPANVQPSYRPSSPENQPNPAPPSNARPSINNEQPNRPATAPSNERPSPNVQPRSAPSEQPNRPATPPPAQENRTAAPRPEPSGNVHAAPQNNTRPSNPTPARSKNNSSDKKKENEKKN